MAKIFCSFLIMAVVCGPVAPVLAQEAEDYRVPLRFDVIGDGVTQLPLELDYDLTSQNELRIGDTAISARSFQIRAGALDEINPIAAPYAGEDLRRGVSLLLTWPRPLIPEGDLEAIGQSGRVLWRVTLSQSQLQSWAETVAEIRTRMQANSKKEELDANPLLASTWIVRNLLESARELIDSQENFRVCISRRTDQGQTRLCSAYMGLKNRDRKWVVEDVPEPKKPARIIAFQKQSPLKSRRQLKGRGPVQFLAELDNGFTYEFVTRPPKIEIAEIVLGDKENIKIVGFGQAPSMPHRILNPQEESLIVRTFRWQETIGDFRRFWEVDAPKDLTTLHFPGPSGGLFKQEFKITRLPREASRPYIDYRTPDSTYVNDAKIYGIRADKTQVSSKENSLEMEGDSSDRFLWYFKHEDRGQMRRAHIEVQDGEQTFKAYYEMHKGYPRELSFRSSAILGSGGNLLINAEGAFNSWFEDILGWSNATWSRQRWGISAKYYRTLTPLKISNTTALMSNTTIDLKYRLRPGLWGRDESWGLMIGYNENNYDIFQPKMLGAGLFWARSMPRLFDDLMNVLPILRYPKWVDMDFVYYPTTVGSSGTTLNQPPAGAGNWALNFHGKVMWTKSFFGEAGFGIRNLDQNQEVVSAGGVQRLRFQFASLYTTVGVGYQF